MYILAAGPYLLYVSGFQDFAQFQRYLANFDKSVYPFTAFKFVPAMNARTHQHLECPAKTVLVYRRRAFKPEINVDMKTRARVDRNRRVGEICMQIPLSRQLRLLKRPFDRVPRGNPRR